MGCCESTLLAETHPEKDNHHHHQQPPQSTNPPFVHPPPSGGPDTGVPSFSEFSFSDLKAATNNFSPNTSSPKAAKEPPILSTRAAYRTAGGSPSRNSPNWLGLTLSNLRKRLGVLESCGIEDLQI
ncbi:hypothetical protein LOK49_LG02G04032 [Camellia lanceoleosa]|uniref:Uncharacterized protein n=1 Tax=Camellia lanceoleosa TaxID=1840588 RepID=A0ACC0IKK8_9ERIC|nr:hypothetical protein LOK49_LG02G04032 [Camellia lanceoleosa]